MTGFPIDPLDVPDRKKLFLPIARRA